MGIICQRDSLSRCCSSDSDLLEKGGGRDFWQVVSIPPFATGCKEPDVTTEDIQPTRASRKSLSKRVRFEVFKRDGFVCQYCGNHPPQAVLHCDHIKPVALGGTNDEENLVTACEDCNLGKSSVPLSSVPESLMSRAAKAAEAEEQIKGYARVLEAKKARVEDDAWRVVYELFRAEEIQRGWFVSIKRFVDLIGVSACLEAAEIAAYRDFRTEEDAFRYFCGVCWKKSKE